MNKGKMKWKDKRILVTGGASFNGTAVNAGTDKFVSLNKAVQCIFDIIGWSPPEGIRYLIDKPVGVRHRAADGTFAKEIMGWQPQYSFEEGLREAIEWYVENKDTKELKSEMFS